MTRMYIKYKSSGCFLSVYGDVQEDNVNWPVTPTAGDEYQSNISNKEVFLLILNFNLREP